MDIAKYSKLATMIYSELIEKNIVDVEISNKRALLYDSQGRPITSDYTVRDKEGKNKETGVSKQVNAFFAGLNWLAFRTIVYTLLANELGIDLILHPIRNSFQVNLLHKLNLFNYPIYSQIISAMNGLVTETLNKVVNIAQPVVIHQQLPLFSAWFAQKTGDPQKFIETAYEIRDQELFIEARKQLIELEDILSKGDKAAYITKANQLILDIQQQMNKICSKFGVITTQGQSISPFIGVWNLSTLATSLPQIPNMNLEIKALSFLKDLLPVKGFKAVYRTLLQDLTQVTRLGELHNIISSKVVLEKDADFFDAKVENSRFLNTKSYWKIPM